MYKIKVVDIIYSNEEAFLSIESNKIATLPKSLFIENEDLIKITNQYGKKLKVGNSSKQLDSDKFYDILFDYLLEKTGEPVEEFSFEIVES